MNIWSAVIWFFVMLGIVVFFESRRRGPCAHINTRCLHGDEITARMKVRILLFWKPDVVGRQVCISCGTVLDRIAICTATRHDIHEWEGPWPYPKEET